MKNEVFLYKVSDYEEKELLKYIKKIIDFSFAAEALAGKKIFVKPNLLMRKKPEEAVTTHPVLIKIICSYLKTKGASVVIGDSPGGPVSSGWLKTVYHSTGMLWAAKESEADLNYDLTSQTVSLGFKNSTRDIQLMKQVLDADIVINIPKFKTHGLTVITGGSKNLYGCIPGLIKAQYHLELPQLNSFCELLVSIADYLKPNLTILDAITVMEGDGPSGGEPKYLGYLLAGRNCFAVDVLASKIIGLDPNSVPILKIAADRNIISLNEKDIAILGDTEYKVTKILMPKTTKYADFSDRFSKIIPQNILENIYKWLKPTVSFSKEKCTQCNICIKSCPVGALEIKRGVPTVNKKECIYCYCCHELCPNKAVSFKRSFLQKNLLRL